MRQDHLVDASARSLRKEVFFLPLFERDTRTLNSGDLGFAWARGRLRDLWFLKSRPEAGPVPGLGRPIARGLTFFNALSKTLDILS